MRFEDLRVLEPLGQELNAEFLEHHALLPVRREDGRVVVATWRDDPDERVLDELRLSFLADLRLMRLPEDEVRAAIRRTYGSEPATAEALIEDLGGPSVSVKPGSSEGALDDLISQANEAPVVRLVNMLLLEALEARASDIHLEEYAAGLAVRYRIDGVLQDAPAPPAHLSAVVVSRLKVMADLDIAERRLPQDGRIRLRLKDREIDVRVSTLPVLHGESVVLRLLDKRAGRIELNALGMASDTLAAFEQAISTPRGMVLTTGPTGSGKTTTLYAALERVRSGREKVLAVEDPVEYELPGVAQVPINPRTGLTFARALRALLRQDPDVLLIGEIRDPETAEIATHAALTGHLVLSTLHTTDAATALTRLLDLGVPPYLVASTVEAALAQRLVRTVCDGCAEVRSPTTEERAVLERRPEELALEELREGRGCDRCRGIGFVGRTGLYEFLAVDDDVRDAIYGGMGAAVLATRAADRGMRRLYEDGLRLVAEGRTTLGEVLRVAL